MAWLTNNPFVTKFNSFRLMRGAVAHAAASVSSHDMYFDVAVTWYTNRVDSLRFPLKDRRFIESGKSGYDLRRLMSHARPAEARGAGRLLLDRERCGRGRAAAGVASLLISSYWSRG